MIINIVANIGINIEQFWVFNSKHNFLPFCSPKAVKVSETFSRSLLVLYFLK